MPTRTYPAIVDFDPGTGNWTIVFPGFPGVTSVAETIADIPRQAGDALASAVEDMEREGEALPPSIEDGAVAVEYDRADYAGPRIWMIPVETQGRAIRINMSMEEGLLARLDEVARRTGATRSALLARGARMVIGVERGT